MHVDVAVEIIDVLVFGQPAELGMEFTVQIDVVPERRLGRTDRTGHLADDIAEGLQPIRGDRLHKGRNRRHLEHYSGIHRVENLRLRRNANAAMAPGTDSHDALDLEAHQRLSDRHRAYAELSGRDLYVDLISVGDLPSDDPLGEQVVGFLTQRSMLFGRPVGGGVGS